MWPEPRGMWPGRQVLEARMEKNCGQGSGGQLRARTSAALGDCLCRPPAPSPWPCRLMRLGQGTGRGPARLPWGARPRVQALGGRDPSASPDLWKALGVRFLAFAWRASPEWVKLWPVGVPEPGLKPPSGHRAPGIPARNERRLLPAPQILCIHLKRFRHEVMYSFKISSHVAFPLEGLDLRPFLAKECKSQITTYDLLSVICHHGTAGSESAPLPSPRHPCPCPPGCP